MKLQGPMFSLGASGSLAGTVTFASWKGRPYARQLVIPSNPKSTAQTVFRLMFGFLSQVWANLDTHQAGAQASWDELAARGNYSAFNAFMKFNQDRWSIFQFPQIEPDIAPVPPDTLTNPGATAGVRSVTVEWDAAAASDQLGVVIYRNEGSQPTGLQTQIIKILPFTDGSPVLYTDMGLTPGIAYYYEMTCISISGHEGTPTTAVNATPTS